MTKTVATAWIGASFVVLFVTLLFGRGFVKQGQSIQHRFAPTMTPTPDMELYELRREARFHVEYGWTAGLEGQSSAEELEALMGEPDSKQIFDEWTYWYYILDPGKDDIFFVLEDGKVKRTALGPLFKKRFAARKEATKTHILESMRIRKLEKEAPAKQLTQVYKLKQEEP